MRIRLGLHAVVVGSLMLAVGACGGDSSDSADSSDTSKPPATTAGPSDSTAPDSGDGAETTAPSDTTAASDGGSLPAEACPLVSDDLLADVLPDAGPGAEQAVPGQEDNMIGCVWDSPTGQLSLYITNMGAIGAPMLSAANELAGAESPEQVPDLGDDAAIAKVGPGPNLAVIDGDFLIQLDLILADSWPAKKDAMVAAGRAIVDQL